MWVGYVCVYVCLRGLYVFSVCECVCVCVLAWFVRV